MDADISSTGLTIVVDPKEANLDIVFVHGFKGHPERTWSFKVSTDDTETEPPTKVRRSGVLPFSTSRKAVYWPRDLLKQSFPEARVLTYGYDTNIRHIAGKPICKNSVYDIAGDLLVELETQRRLAPERRLIFIAHSLGGIVVKEMLRRSSSFQHDRQAHLRQTCDSTIGIMFFGTPHQGADPRRLLQKVAETAAKAIGFNVNQQIVDTLLPSSERLRELRDEFGPMAQLRGWTIHSFQESLGIRPLEGRKVVDDTSSYINLPDVETTQHIVRDHMDMCRFSGPLDAEFSKVEAALRRMVDKHTASQQSKDIGRSIANSDKETIISALKFDQIDFRRTAIKAAHRKTCKWILKEPVYTEWLDLSRMAHHHGFLWIKGKPGTGKSTIMKFALANTQRTRKDRISISFFFNARGSPLERSTQGMYRSLLSQLLKNIPDDPDILDALSQISAASLAQGSWSIESLKGVFEQIVLGLGRTSVICFIDALDECDENEIRDMVSFFESLSDFVVEADIQFEVCLASRHYPHISMYRGQELTLETNHGHDEDITEYIDSELKIGYSKLATQIRSDLQEKAAGIFMWVVLVVDILNKEFDSGRIHKLRARLAELPSDLHGLFRDIMTRDNRNTQDLLHCLQWILFSSRPLSPEELYCALLIEEMPFQIDHISSDEITLEIQQRFILDTSKGLAEVVHGKNSSTSVVQFIHESVRDFFLKENGMVNVWPHLETNLAGISHEYLRLSCEAYIHVDIRPFIPDRESDKPTLQDCTWATVTEVFPFLQYATQNVLWHADKAQKAGIDQLEYLKGFERERWRWIRLSNFFEKFAIRRYHRTTRLLYILAEKNLNSLISLHPESLTYLNGHGCERYQTPFVAAMVNGSHQAIQRFFELEIQNQPQATCLVELYNLYRSRCDEHPKCSREHAVPMLSDRGEVIWSKMPQDDGLLLAFLMMAKKLEQDFFYYLMLAKWHRPVEFSGFITAAGLLGPEKTSPEIYGMALILALKYDTKSVIRGILDPDNLWPLWEDSCDSDPTSEHAITTIDIGDSDSVSQQTPFSFRNIKYDVTDEDTGDSLLSLATRLSNVPVIQFLLATNAVHLRQRNDRGETCLHIAAFKGHVKAIDVLLTCHEIFPLVNIPDKSDRTPLHVACRCGNYEIVERLLSLDTIDANKKSKGDPPLFLAISSGSVETVRALLASTKVDVNVFSARGKSFLALVMEAKQDGMLKDLLATGRVNLDDPDRSTGLRPLELAHLISDPDHVALLLKAGATFQTLTHPRSILENQRNDKSQH